ncbi:histidine utilization repressor, partial [Erwinia amylovora]|nr:histidine utilization repressor [Erwinia amylovora]
MTIHSGFKPVNCGYYDNKEFVMVRQTAISQLSAAMSDRPAPIYQRVKQAIVSQISE